jgi:hypothetical protein
MLCIKVFGRQRLLKIRVKETDMIKPFAVMLFVDFVILVSWMASDPPTLLFHPMKYAVPGYIEGVEAITRECHYNKRFFFPFLGYKILAVSVGCYLAFLTRNVDKRYLQVRIWKMLSHIS